MKGSRETVPADYGQGTPRLEDAGAYLGTLRLSRLEVAWHHTDGARDAAQPHSAQDSPSQRTTQPDVSSAKGRDPDSDNNFFTKFPIFSLLRSF